MIKTKALPKGLKISKFETGIEAVLYQTKIVSIFGTRITLRHGGWLTMHTKKCINLVLKPYGIQVYQKKNVWYIDQGSIFDLNFQDGMVIDTVQLSLNEAA